MMDIIDSHTIAFVQRPTTLRGFYLQSNNALRKEKNRYIQIGNQEYPYYPDWSSKCLNREFAVVGRISAENLVVASASKSISVTTQSWTSNTYLSANTASSPKNFFRVSRRSCLISAALLFVLLFLLRQRQFVIIIIAAFVEGYCCSRKNDF